ncbi:MAG: hypothetical protein JWN70_3661 [Planctomycetaceae bacterium]|nr:hypothetical protein [Planctomycetaceae bacterium]
MQLLDGYCLDLTSHSAAIVDLELATTVYRLTCRTDFETPGFALINLGPNCDSITLRSWMVQLKDRLDELHQRQAGDHIVAVWLGRFNQQITTKFHLDGGPDASLLMLGYEPTTVTSQIRLADVSQCAASFQLTPEEFMDRHNPMFPAGEELLRPFITDISRANSDHFHILLVNNSRQSLTDHAPGWQGVLHQAIMMQPQPGARRVVNSMMLAVGDPATDALTDVNRQDYLTTDQLNQRMQPQP